LRLFEIAGKITAMSNKLISFVIIALVFAFPFRWAYISDVSHFVSLLGFLITLAAFFVILVLLNKDDKNVAGH